ncbi:MAG TPA: hypothetical protein VIH90_06490 [Candidatus Saccharimonadales bacterium]
MTESDGHAFTEGSEQEKARSDIDLEVRSLINVLEGGDVPYASTVLEIDGKSFRLTLSPVEQA